MEIRDVMGVAALLCLLVPFGFLAAGERKFDGAQAAEIVRVALPPGVAEAQPGPAERLAIVTAGGKRLDFNVEVVSTPMAMMQGLMFRAAMRRDHGMLFVFPGEGERSFWMKNTYLPLDIVFIRANGEIANVGYGKPLSLDEVRSEGMVLHVLELNAGTARQLGVEKGDIVHHPAFGNALE